jgi:ABC-type Zn uptake system ZnuABC Zn-binding protein ZnuA
MRADRIVLGISLLIVFSMVRSVSAAELEVVTTLPAYEAIAREIAGERANVQAISRGDEDAHFVKPKPSFALMLKKADVFITTGLDLELWAPVLIDKAGNRDIREGQPGYVSASQGVPLLDVPEVADRSGGDVHLYGNPHIFTSPLNVKQVAGNIARALEVADPAGAEEYRERLESFVDRMNAALYGEELVEMLGAETLDSLARSGRLVSFLEGQEFEGSPLIERLGGWLGKGLAFRDRKIVAYHKNWIYFTDLFGLDVVDYVEPKPGIPPSARHVHKLIGQIADEEIQVLLAANYFSARQIQSISNRTGCTAVVVPLGPGGDGPVDYFGLVDLWVDGLAEAFSE